VSENGEKKEGFVRWGGSGSQPSKRGDQGVGGGSGGGGLCNLRRGKKDFPLTLTKKKNENKITSTAKSNLEQKGGSDGIVVSMVPGDGNTLKKDCTKGEQGSARHYVSSTPKQGTNKTIKCLRKQDGS